MTDSQKVHLRELPLADLGMLRAEFANILRNNQQFIPYLKMGEDGSAEHTPEQERYLGIINYASSCAIAVEEEIKHRMISLFGEVPGPKQLTHGPSDRE